MKTVLIVDDHSTVRVGLRHLIESMSGPPRVDETGTLRDAIDLLMRKSYDLIVYDWHLPDGGGMRGLIAVRQLTAATPVVVISADLDDSVPFAALEAGAQTFLPKGADVARTMEVLAECLVDSGPESHTGRVSCDVPEPALQLSRRQRDVLDMLARGLPDKRIAEALGIANATVRAHVSGLLRLLHVQNRTEAVVKASRLKLIDTFGVAPHSPR